MDDTSAETIAQFQAQMATLIAAVPRLLALGPNADQLVNMGKAMFQAAAQVPPGPVQAAYLQGMQELASAIKANAPAPAPAR